MLKQQSKLLSGIEMIKATLDEDGELMPIARRETAPPPGGLPIGAVAPKFSLQTMTGERMSLDDLLGSGKPVLLVFASASCWDCKTLLPAVRAWERDYADRLTIAVLSSGTPEEIRDKIVKYEISNLLIDEEKLVADDYQANWSPAAVLIHPDGKIASQNTYSDTAIREWLRNLMSSGEVQPVSSNGKSASSLTHQVAISYSVREVGEPAPSFWLKDLSGRAVDIKDFRGSPTLLLFWHPRCLICGSLFDDLRAWEDDPPEGAPRLVFVACGEMEEVTSINKYFKSITLLDPAFDIGPLFGTKFTPSAILLDSENRIASSLAMGAENVRALIGLPKAELPVALQL
jgi:peroxiredoxin